MAKSTFLQIRLSPEDRQRLRDAAEDDCVGMSTWARRAILRALVRWEAGQAYGYDAPAGEAEHSDAPAMRRVAEPEPGPKPTPTSSSTPKPPKRSR